MEPATTEPETIVPTTNEPATTGTSTIIPGTTEPTTTVPTTLEPATTEPATTVPVTTEPATSQSATTEPSITEPSTTEPTTMEPATTSEPVTIVPNTTLPATAAQDVTEPATTEPNLAQSATTEPTTSQLPTTEPASTISTTTAPGTTEPATTQPTTSQVTTTQSTTTEPIATQLATTQSTTTAPAGADPTTTGPAPTEPTTTGPALTEPETNMPVVSEPTTTQQAASGPSQGEPPTQPVAPATQPGAASTTVADPTTTEPTVTQASTPGPYAAEPTATDPATVQPAATNLVTSTPTATTTASASVTTTPETAQPIAATDMPVYFPNEIDDQAPVQCGNDIVGAVSCDAGFYCQPVDASYYQCVAMCEQCSTPEVNIDYFGDDLDLVDAADASGCCDVCASREGCAAYTFVASAYHWDGVAACYLKSGVGERKAAVGAVSATVAPVTPKPTVNCDDIVTAALPADPTPGDSQSATVTGSTSVTTSPSSGNGGSAVDPAVTEPVTTNSEVTAPSITAATEPEVDLPATVRPVDSASPTTLTLDPDVNTPAYAEPTESEVPQPPAADSIEPGATEPATVEPVTPAVTQSPITVVLDPAVAVPGTVKPLEPTEPVATNPNPTPATTTAAGLTPEVVEPTLAASPAVTTVQVDLPAANNAGGDATGASAVDTCGAPEENVDFFGADIGRVKDGDATGCCDACLAQAACAAYTFVDSSRSWNGHSYCYLKSAIGERRELPGAVSVSVTRGAAPSSAARCGDGCANGYYCQPTSATKSECVATPDGADQPQEGVDFYGDDLWTVFVPSAAECVAQCVAVGPCTAFTFVLADEACYLKFGTGEAKTLVGAVSATVQHEDDTDSTCGEQEAGVDFYGDDLFRVDAPSAISCCAACSDTPSCAAYTFVDDAHSWDGLAACYLKWGTGNKTRKAGAISAVVKREQLACTAQIGDGCGGASCCASGSYCQPWSLNDYRCVVTPAQCSSQLTDVDFFGSDMDVQFGLQPDECCALCADTDGCVAYTFENESPEAQGACYLKSSTTGRVAKKGCVSGTVNVV